MQAREELTGRSVGLQSCDDTGLGDLVRTAVLHVHGCQQKHIALLRHPGCDGLHDFTVDRLLIVGDQVLVQELLDLVGREPREELELTPNGSEGVLTHIQQMS